MEEPGGCLEGTLSYYTSGRLTKKVYLYVPRLSGTLKSFLKATILNGQENKYEYHQILYVTVGFPGSSAGKESTFNEGDPSLIPGSGRSPGEGIGYLLQYSCASSVAQRVKSPSAMQKTLV